MQNVLDHYGDMRRKTYNEETAGIINMIQEFDSRCPDAISEIAIRAWLDDLASENTSFAQLMGERHDEKALQAAGNLRETRLEIDKTYTQMIDRINASILLNGEADYIDFVNKYVSIITKTP